MNNKLALLFSIAFLASCSSATNTQTTAQNQQATKAEVAKSNSAKANTTANKAESAATKDSDLICRTERPLGTRFGKKVCRTRSQILEERKQAKDMMPRHRDCSGPSEVCI